MLLIAMLLSFTAVASLTAFIVMMAAKFGLLDTPVARSAHQHPKPLGGGIALSVPFFFTAIFWMLAGDAIDMWPAFASCLFVLIVGFVDDARSLSLRARLPLHFLAAAMAVAVYKPSVIELGFWNISNPFLLSLLATLSLVWLVNLTNFMDGIDGLAAVQLLFVALGCAVLLLYSEGNASLNMSQDAKRFVILLSVVLAGSALGFLLWNWAPSRLFMGDSGSGFIGFALGLLALETITVNSLTLWSWLLLMGVFIVDTGVTLATRVLNGSRWYEGHSQHAYQILSRALGSHARVVLRVLLIDIFWLLPLAWLAGSFPQLGVVFAIIGLLPLSVYAVYLGAGRLEHDNQGSDRCELQS